MKFAFIPHLPKTEGQIESIRLDLGSYDNTENVVKIIWQRGKNGDWANPVVESFPLTDIGGLRTTLSSIMNFITKHEIDIDNPDALITAIEREDGSCYVRNGSGRLVKYADVAKNSDRDEYVTDEADGMKLKWSVFAEDEDRAKSAIMRMMVGRAEEDDSVYDEIRAWGKGGKPVKKLVKKGTVTAPDLGVYCKRGQQRAALGLRLKKTGDKKTETKAGK